MAVAFDTLKAATRLREEAGFDEKQATALVQTFADRGVENLGRTRDLENTELALRGDMEKNARREATWLERDDVGTVIAAGVAIVVALDKLL